MEIVDDATHKDRMSAEILKRAGSIEHLDEIVVEHHERIISEQLTVTVRVVRREHCLYVQELVRR